MNAAPAIAPEPDAPEIQGLSTLAHLVYGGAPQDAVREALTRRLGKNPADAGALMDASVLLQLNGNREAGLSVQHAALQHSRVYRRRYGDVAGAKILALMIAGDFMANTPFDFLLDGSDAEVHLVYVDALGRLPDTIPDHDVCFVAIGESEANRPALLSLSAALATWPRPVVNRDVAAIAALSRDGVSSAFEDSAHVVAPPVRRFERDRLLGLAGGDPRLDAVFGPAVTWPMIVRPVDSHAGAGLEKIERATDLEAYLQGRCEPAFYLSPFVDYSSPDGLFRKLRIAVIDGAPFISHLAISSHWMVHYLSAGMADCPAKRAEEAGVMADFEAGFASRQALAVADLSARIGLDYFAIDCAELPDGRLLLFEADVAMIVHDLDDGERFGYKRAPMRRLFKAFQAALAQRHEAVKAVAA